MATESKIHSRKHLSFTGLRKTFSNMIFDFPDPRTGSNYKYSVHDVVMSGFACMFFQNSSLLQFQRSIQKAWHKNNLRTLFGVEKIPEDTQLRDILEQIPSQSFESVFNEYFYQLQRGKVLERFEFFPSQYICSMDGSQYFGSNQIACPKCLIKESKKGKEHFSHLIVQSAIMHPDLREVIPFVPEEIRNEDGTEKQDCEINGSKRLVLKLKKAHPRLNLIINGDGLFSKQPMIEKVREQNWNYFFVAKPTDHKLMMKWINEQKNLGEFEYQDQKGRVHSYQWINQAPLNGRQDSVWVNYFAYQLKVEGKVTYQNSWITDFVVSEDNVSKLTRGARCRWKIENEVFNTLKNQGYHIEHNYGHGEKNLSFNFFLLNLMAFLYHQIFELTNRQYQRCRQKWVSRRYIWEQIRGAINIVIFENFELLLEFIYDPNQFEGMKPIPRPP